MKFATNFCIVKESYVTEIMIFDSVPHLNNLSNYKCYLSSSIEFSNGFLKFSGIRRHFVEITKDTTFIMGKYNEIERIENIEQICVKLPNLFNRNKFFIKKGLYLKSKFEHETFWVSNWIVRWMNGFDPLKQKAS